jgi:hypothetical protein
VLPGRVTVVGAHPHRGGQGAQRPGADGFHICPDIDTLTYTLSGVSNMPAPPVTSLSG